MNGFLFGTTMGLMMGAGMMMTPASARLRRTAVRKMRCAMKHLKHQ